MVKTSTSQAATEAKPTMMKAVHAAHIVDKNSRTIAKILQLLEVTQRPSAANVDTEGHTTRRVEKLKNRLNRRLQKLARWGDKPVDDRQPAEMRMSLRSGVQTQFKSSFAGISNIPIPVQAPAYTSSRITDQQRVPYVIPIAPTPSNPSTVTASLAAASAAVAATTAAAVAIATAAASTSAPSSSASLPDRGVITNQVKEISPPKIESSAAVATVTKPTGALSLPSFSSLQDQSQLFGLNNTSSSSNGAPSGGVTPVAASSSASSSGKSMMGSMGSMGGMSMGMGGMSMGGVSSGGMKMDFDAIRAMQMQSVKELSALIKGEEPISSSSSSSSTSSSSTSNAPQVVPEGEVIPAPVSVPVSVPVHVSNPVTVTADAMDVVEEPVISAPAASATDVTTAEISVSHKPEVDN